MFYFSASKSVKFPERQEVTSATHLCFTVKGSYHYSKYVDLAAKFFECVHLKTSATNVVLYLKIFQHQPASELYKCEMWDWDKRAFVYIRFLHGKTHFLQLWNLEAGCAIRQVRTQLRFWKNIWKWVYQRCVLTFNGYLMQVTLTFAATSVGNNGDWF